MPKKNFKCTAAYKGTSFYGWQRQNDFLTVQGIIEYALEKHFGYAVKTMGASRTDAGVHAKGQVFNFFADTKLAGENIKPILNNLLPDEIRITGVREVNEKFKSRYNVRKKFYRYVIYNSGFIPPFFRENAWHVNKPLDVKKMEEIFPFFEGVKDYFSFSRSGSEAVQFERRVDGIKIKKNGKWITLDFFGKGFLYQQIRRMAAVFAAYAAGDIGREIISDMFAVRDRSVFRESAPACGLYLVKIIYEGKYNV
ncbi:MAG TPA: tRNA pseudouridine(38-40) synthase TruA [Firmicutes bacterium]|nr:tRNA pseudouridine(38-40) synthase TruA [Bacillota bacterium]